MQKKLLLLASVLMNFLGFSQGSSCSNATVLNANGTYTCTPINSGTYQPTCFSNGTEINGKWYQFTPATNGVVSISSNLESNQGINTRLSVMSGTCGALLCVAANDDFDPSFITNRLSFVFLAVEAGTTYYIQWDSTWDISGFDFEYNFSPSNCLPLNQFSVYNPLYVTANSATLKWNNAIGSPENYVVEWHPDFDPIQSINATSVFFTADNGASSIKTISDLPSGENISYFVSSLCGTAPNYTGQSTRRGPFTLFLAKNLPYSLNFEQEFPTTVFNDGFIGFRTFLTEVTTEPANYADGGTGTTVYTPNSTAEFSNHWGYSRGINLVAGQQVNISFKSRLFAFSGNPSPMSLKLTAGLAQNPSAQLELIDNYALTTANAYSTHTAIFTVPTTDVYYFGFQNNSLPGTNQTFAFLDTFDFTASLSNQEFLKSQVRFSPNPASNFIKFSNSDIEITKIQILDLNGRTIRQIDLQNSLNTSVDVTTLLNGIYLIKVITENGILTQKLIRN